MFHSVFSPATGKCCFTPLGDSLQIYPNLSDKTNKLRTKYKNRQIFFYTYKPNSSDYVVLSCK